MSKEPRINKNHSAGTRSQACENIAMDFMERNKPLMAEDFMKAVSMITSADDSEKKMVLLFLEGYADGFAMALELVMSGALNIKEIVTIEPER